MEHITKYVYRFNSLKWFIQGIVPSRGTRVTVHNEYGTLKNLVWRNSHDEDHFLSPSFKDVPLELSYFLLNRTRERLILENRLQKDNSLLSGRKFS